MLRTNTCGELTKKDLNKKVELCGWVDSIREHGGIAFINLRDRYGLTQVVFDDPTQLKELKNESVVRISGKVRARPEGIFNKKISTGEIEVLSSKLEVLNGCEVLPLDMSGKIESTEETRLKYRYLDLRKNMNNMVLRHKATMAMHEYLDKEGFLYVETPLLIRATPEGARDFVVPSRLHPGSIYSLPQSPQLYKQISMVAGFDKYYQLAKCLRDEDLRVDRQPEFTQIDFEMSFVEQEDVMKTAEGLVETIFKKCGVKIKPPFPRMTYHEAMEKYGIDRPDLRFDLELADVTEIAHGTDFNVFKTAGMVKALVVEEEFSRKQVDKLTELVKVYKAKGLAYMKYGGSAEGFDAGITKFIDNKSQEALVKALKLKKKSTVFFVADKPAIVNDALAHLRLHFGKELKLYDPAEYNFVWVTDFPLFEFDDETNRWSPMHHIFSMPKEESIPMLESDPGKVTGYLYDLTLNGIELGGGSIRIHRKDIQEAVLKVIGMDYKQAEERFGFLLESFKYGAPPHGGLAFGFDRMVAMIKGTPDIKEVIAYPKNKQMECPMDGCPSPCDPEAAEELHVKFVKPE